MSEKERVVKEKAAIKEFLETAPLYKSLGISLPETYGHFLPTVLHLHCSCANERQPYRNKESARITDEAITYVGVDRGAGHLGALLRVDIMSTPGIYSLIYQCQGCHAVFFCWLSFGFKDNTEGTDGVVHKVGQTPPFDIHLSKSEVKRIGDEAAYLYRRAQICISQSFGIAACVYLRRVLEAKINDLLTINLEIGTAEAAGEGELKKFTDAINTKVFMDKIQLISAGLPDSVEVPGNNPVLLVYRQLSNALHSLSDQEATTVAEKCSLILMHLMVGLQEEREHREEYSRNVRALAGAKLNPVSS